MSVNRQVLATGPAQGGLSLECFRVAERAVPSLRDGEILIENHVLTVDPAQVRRFRSYANYLPAFVDGDVIPAFAAGHVAASRSAAFAEGDAVAYYGAWEEYGVTNADAAAQNAFALRKVDTRLAPLSRHVGVLGNKGFSADLCVRHFGRTRPGDVVLVSGAAGAVGSIAGQLAKVAGARTVGIAGGERKRAALLAAFGFDAAVDYRSGDFEQALDSAVPDGADVYVDNVGGRIQAAAFDRMRFEGRAVICGMIDDYLSDRPQAGPNLFVAVSRGFSIQGFLASNYTALFQAFVERTAELLRAGVISIREDVIDGLEHAPAALIGLMAGENIGQRLVRVRRGSKATPGEAAILHWMGSKQ